MKTARKPKVSGVRNPPKKLASSLNSASSEEHPGKALLVRKHLKKGN